MHAGDSEGGGPTRGHANIANQCADSGSDEGEKAGGDDVRDPPVIIKEAYKSGYAGRTAKAGAIGSERDAMSRPHSSKGLGCCRAVRSTNGKGAGRQGRWDGQLELNHQRPDLKALEWLCGQLDEITWPVKRLR